MAVTETMARDQAAEESGYSPKAIGRLAQFIEQRSNSRQNAYVFETSNNVTKHPLYVKAKLSDVFDLTGSGVDDGAILSFGPEVTAGG